MNRTGTIDNRAAGIRMVMTGAIFRFIRSTIARKTSGSKVAMDLLKASHGPQNSPETKAERTMLMSSHIFKVIGPPCKSQLETDQICLFILVAPCIYTRGFTSQRNSKYFHQNNDPRMTGLKLGFTCYHCSIRYIVNMFEVYAIYRILSRLRQTNFCRRAQKRGNTSFLAKN